jgi:hypothetical protein
MTVCNVCGLEWWTFTRNKDAEGNALASKVARLPQGSPEASHQQCSRCVEAYQRSPELVAWILGVVRKAIK